MSDEETRRAIDEPNGIATGVEDNESGVNAMENNSYINDEFSWNSERESYNLSSRTGSAIESHTLLLLLLIAWANPTAS